ncbi:hypothetical protein JTB14_002525 [Gonioctena quinquepunctata]|nr:hypothetical protein JTB14_002525 [Gonioctena quinquepunctata]
MNKDLNKAEEPDRKNIDIRIHQLDGPTEHSDQIHISDDVDNEMTTRKTTESQNRNISGNRDLDTGMTSKKTKEQALFIDGLDHRPDIGERKKLSTTEHVFKLPFIRKKKKVIEILKKREKPETKREGSKGKTPSKKVGPKKGKNPFKET